MFKNMFEVSKIRKKVDNGLIVLTNLGPKSVNLIFYAPNVSNLEFWRILPTIAL